jgi:hypothetical protein
MTSSPEAMRGAAGFLSLAAAPTFAAMALLSALGGGGPLEALCAAAPGGSMLSGMATMYGLMSAFHAGPWLRLLARRRSPAHHPRKTEADMKSMHGRSRRMAL